MNLLWLYFDNGLDEEGNKKTFKGIIPNENGYKFDNRFNIKFDKLNKIIYIEENPKYVKLYNNALTSISCLVGKNGSGKTTFFELIITNISWGMNSDQPEFLISLYYQLINNEPKFFLQLYRGNAKNEKFKLFFKKVEDKKFYKIDYEQHTNNSPYSTNMIPKNTKYIFHSLSPFDKIFYSIAKPLKKHEKRIFYFKEQMDYIGIQKMFSDEFGYEIDTLANFIFMFRNDYFRSSFIEALNFEYDKMELNLNNDFYNFLKSKNNIFFDELDEMLNKLNTYSNLEEYKNLSNFVLLDKKEQKNFFHYIFEGFKFDLKNNNEIIIWLLILSNINFNKFVNNYYIKNLENFFEILNLSNCIDKEKKEINYDCLIEEFLSIRHKRKAFFEKNIDEKVNLLKQLNIFDFVKQNIYEIDFDALQMFLHLVRFLTANNLVNFEIYLKKDNGEKINYFFLSSGEKTMISYFANIVASIYKFKPLKNKTFIILIDEVELHLHPEWQRRFINYINSFFRENNLNIKFQFIIATHSPFVLSDIVDEQIIYIKDISNLSINTFGANIYDIFEKGFFLENSIGKYSEEMIKAISLILTFYQSLYLAEVQSNVFVLRNLLNIWYKTKNGKLNELYKEKKDKYFIKAVKKCEFKILKELFFKHDLKFEKFKILFFDNNRLSENIINYINIIGDPIVKNHLLALYESVKVYLNEYK